MALIGLGLATVVSTIVFVRSAETINKTLTVALWAVFAVYSFGVRI